MDAEQRTRLYGLLEAVITADGVTNPDEREFLRRAMVKLRLSDEPATESLQDIGSATTALRTLDADAQARVLALLVEAAVVDGVVSPSERALLLAAAATLGIEATALEERIARRLKTVAGN